MRIPTLLFGVPITLLLLGVLVHASLAPLVACLIDRPAAVATVASVSPMSSAAAEDRPSRAEDGSAAPGSADPDQTDVEPCTLDLPCHDSPDADRATDDLAVRSVSATPAAGPPLLPVRVDGITPDRVPPAPPAEPVLAPAVRASVAVLCVDRN